MVDPLEKSAFYLHSEYIYIYIYIYQALLQEQDLTKDQILSGV